MAGRPKEPNSIRSRGGIATIATDKKTRAALKKLAKAAGRPSLSDYLRELADNPPPKVLTAFEAKAQSLGIGELILADIFMKVFNVLDMAYLLKENDFKPGLMKAYDNELETRIDGAELAIKELFKRVIETVKQPRLIR